MTPARALFVAPARRVLRSPRAWVPLFAWTALALAAAAVFARARAGAEGALVDTFGALVVPFLAFAIAGAVLDGEGLARSLRPFVVFGAPAGRVALASLAVAAGLTIALVAPLGAIVAVVAHGAYDPPVALDALTTAGVAALGGATYAALFVFGASFGKRGIGRPIVLGADFVLGAADPLDVVTPRGHLRALLGGDAVIDLSGRTSSLALVLLAVLFGAMAIRRARRPTA